MKEIEARIITQEIKTLFMETNYHIGQDVYHRLEQYRQKEASPIGLNVLNQLLLNYDIASKEKIAICQDTGMSIIFIELGQDVHIIGGDLTQAINQGVEEAYAEGYLRKSVVDDPLFARVNTKTNTPAVIHIDIVPGESIRILSVAKGFGSENMSALKMLVPADGVEGVKQFVLDTVRKAGPNACPPLVVGVGIGGTMEKAAILAKKATARDLNTRNLHKDYAQLEEDLLTSINKLGIGPGGLGGRTTAIGVNIEYFPTHIAGLPVAVNICCHAARHASKEIVL